MPLLIWALYYAWGGSANTDNPFGEAFDIYFTPDGDDAL